MPTLKNHTQSNDIVHENRESPALGPKAQSGVSRLRLAVPGAAFLATLGLFGYAISAGGRSDRAPTPPASNAGTTGDFAPQAGWIKNLEAQLSVFGYESSFSQFAGNGHRFASLPLTDLPKFVAAAIASAGPADIRLALSTPTGGQTGKAQVVASEEATLDSLSIEFPGNSARILSRDVTIIRKAAQIIKALPAGTSVELIGYTGETSTSPRGGVLAQARAKSVYKALVRAGVNPAVLSPKGRDSASNQAGAGPEMEGRSSTGTETPRRPGRRVEFRIVAPQR
jgi:outer membrane protein OmpA-like peptidoglycan-associated protein